MCLDESMVLDEASQVNLVTATIRYRDDVLPTLDFETKDIGIVI